MKTSAINLLSLLLLFSFASLAQSPQLKKLWETDSTLKVPESVLYYETEKILFVSNIDGKSGEKDLVGSIRKVSLDGKIISPAWATNLSAPKGMGISGTSLYVADLHEIVVIDLKSGKVTDRIPVSGSIFLNDITIDPSGVVYVSDSKTGKVHTIRGKTVTTYLENKPGVNGLLAIQDELYLVAKGTLYRADKNKNVSTITEGMDESTDGIVQVGKDFIVSCWNGIIYHVSATGQRKTLLDTRSEKSNTADIGYDPATRTLFVPTFFKNKVVAYRLD